MGDPYQKMVWAYKAYTHLLSLTLTKVGAVVILVAALHFVPDFAAYTKMPGAKHSACRM